MNQEQTCPTRPSTTIEIPLSYLKTTDTENKPFVFISGKSIHYFDTETLCYESDAFVEFSDSLQSDKNARLH